MLPISSNGKNFDIIPHTERVTLLPIDIKEHLTKNTPISESKLSKFYREHRVAVNLTIAVGIYAAVVASLVALSFFVHPAIGVFGLPIFFLLIIWASSDTVNPQAGKNLHWSQRNRSHPDVYPNSSFYEVNIAPFFK